VEQVRTQVLDSPPPVVDFAIGEGGTRSVFLFDSIAALTVNREIAVRGPRSSAPINMTGLTLIPGAVGRIGFGRLVAANFIVHPGEYIPEVATRTGMVAAQGTSALYFNVVLPSGMMPPGGWPVAIYGHASERDKNQVFDSAASLASRGIAVIAISMVGHGFGPESTITTEASTSTPIAVLLWPFSRGDVRDRVLCVHTRSPRRSVPCTSRATSRKSATEPDDTTPGWRVLGRTHAVAGERAIRPDQHWRHFRAPTFLQREPSATG
jgi:hypothetical protein